jgi:drug/metabolite transporter (DMT)-like permease
MAAYETEKPVFLIKKLGGLLLLICGILLVALAYSDGSTGLTVLGILLAAGGVVLMALKIYRRNQVDPL